MGMYFGAAGRSRTGFGAALLLGLLFLLSGVGQAEEDGSGVAVEVSSSGSGSESREQAAEANEAAAPTAAPEAQETAQPTASAASASDVWAGGASWGDQLFVLPSLPGRSRAVQIALTFAERGFIVSATAGREALQRRLAQDRLHKELAPAVPGWGETRRPSSNRWPSGKAAEWLSRYYLCLPSLDSAYSVYGDEQARQFADAEYMLTNEIRVGKGLNALRRDPHLDAVAQAHALHMAQTGFFDHANPYGMQVFERMDAADCPRWSSAGENIAAGQRTPDEVHRTWMKSKGHKHNILSRNYDCIGIGAIYAPNTEYGWYWVQVFASFDGNPDQHDWIDPGEQQ